MKLKFILIAQILVFSSIHGQVGIVNQNKKNKPTITFVGTYHMGNQGNNVYKGTYDDIMHPEKQKELDSLIKKLKAYKPTKIMIEADIKYDSIIQDRYAKYLNDNFELKRNEIYQIGFKLAKGMGHDSIYSVDWGIFPKDELYWFENFAKTIPELDNYYNDLKQSGAEKHKKSNEELMKLTIVDRIRRLNEEERIEKSHLWYYSVMRIGWEDKYVGANYLSWWYGRNMKILINIIRATESPNDRILVIYGFGHLKLLNQLTEESKFYDVIKSSEVLKN